MTAPQQTRQPAATPQQVAAGLYAAQTPDDAAAVLSVLLLLDMRTARQLVVTVWPNGSGWRIAPGADPAAWQALYVMNAADRIRASLAAGDSLKQAIAREQPYAEAHRQAQAARAAAMTDVRRAKRQYGRLLGWKAHKDDRTTPACRIADGANFNAATGPWPGTAHGGTCRCTATKPFATSRMVVAEWVKAGLGEHAEGAA